MSSQSGPKAAFICNNESAVQRVYGQGRRAALEAGVSCWPVVVNEKNWAEQVPHLREVEAVFSTWGMPALSREQIAQLPALKAVFYAAGSVQHFARPLLESGITVVSAWAANAVPVAEFTLAQILLANKGYFRNQREYRAPECHRTAFRGSGNFGATVALLGAGQIGRRVLELLRPFQLHVLVFDPYLAEAAARELGVEKVSLEEAFRRGNVVSNHLANLPATRGMLRGPHFDSMPEHAVFINTGRGATVAEAELIEVLQRRPDLYALLDVTAPEPPAADSPLYTLPNVRLSSHIAGSIGDEVIRMADYMIEEFEAWRRGRPLRYAVDLEMLETMA